MPGLALISVLLRDSKQYFETLKVDNTPTEQFNSDPGNMGLTITAEDIKNVNNFANAFLELTKAMEKPFDPNALSADEQAQMETNKKEYQQICASLDQIAPKYTIALLSDANQKLAKREKEDAFKLLDVYYMTRPKKTTAAPSFKQDNEKDAQNARLKYTIALLQENILTDSCFQHMESYYMDPPKDDPTVQKEIEDAGIYKKNAIKKYTDQKEATKKALALANNELKELSVINKEKGNFVDWLFNNFWKSSKECLDIDITSISHTSSWNDSEAYTAMKDALDNLFIINHKDVIKQDLTQALNCIDKYLQHTQTKSIWSMRWGSTGRKRRNLARKIQKRLIDWRDTFVPDTKEFVDELNTCKSAYTNKTNEIARYKTMYEAADQMINDRVLGMPASLKTLKKYCNKSKERLDKTLNSTEFSSIKELTKFKNNVYAQLDRYNINNNVEREKLIHSKRK